MPPRCPKCNKPLETVKEIEEEQYRYNPKTGSYTRATLFLSSLQVVCPKCGADITDLFPDGVCNYNKTQPKR